MQPEKAAQPALAGSTSRGSPLFRLLFGVSRDALVRRPSFRASWHDTLTDESAANATATTAAAAAATLVLLAENPDPSIAAKAGYKSCS